MAITNRSTIVAALDPDVRRWIGDGYTKTNRIMSQIGNVLTSDRRSEKVVLWGELGLLRKKWEGNPVQYDAPSQGPDKNFVHETFALGVKATFELLDDSEYQPILEFGKMLGSSAAETEEVYFSDLFNSGFVTTTYTTASTGAIFSSQTIMGQTVTSKAATATALTYDTYLSALYTIRAQKNSRGGVSNYGDGQLVLMVPVQLEAKAREIVDSVYKPDTADNNINFINKYAKPMVVVNKRLTSTTAWFLWDKTNADGFIWYRRMRPTLSRDGDFDTGDFKWKIMFRASRGVADPRGLFGNQGA